MRRALLTTVGLAGLAAATVPVLAAPAPLDAGRMAGTRVTTTLPDGDSLSLEIRAAELSAGPRVLVYSTRCDGDACATRQFSASLPASALSIDDSAAKANLSLPLDGRVLVVSWRPTDAQGPEAAYGSTDESDGTGSQYLGDAATTTVQYAGHTCTGRGGVGEGAIFDTSTATGDAGPAPLSRLNLPDGTAFRC
jgi:hypothetical protein